MNVLQTRRRALMGAQQSSARIPSAYQEVVWVGLSAETNVGNAKLDTLYVPKTNPQMQCRWMTGGGSRGTVSLFDSSSTTSPFFVFYSGAAGSNIALKARFGNASEKALKSDAATWTWYDVVIGTDCYINGTKVHTFSSTYDWTNNTDSIKLFAGLSKSSARFSGDVLIYDGSTLVRDFVPCYRKSDSRVGFYDLISEQFYTNASTTNVMSKGADVT